MALNEDDVTEQMVSMSTHDFLLVFTAAGRVYRMKGYNVPLYSRTSKGIPVVNLLKLDKSEKVCALVAYRGDEGAKFLFFVTRQGLVKRTPIQEFYNINTNGKIAIRLREGDELAFVKGTCGHEEVLIAGSNGKAVHFLEDTIRPLSRDSMGVRGFNTDGSTVVGMAVSSEGTQVLTVTENGYGKKSDLKDYRITSRGAKGVKALNTDEKTGRLVALKAVKGDKDCLIMTSEGVVIRISLSQVNTYSRNAKGVKLISLADNTRVAAVALVDPEPAEEEPAAQ